MNALYLYRRSEWGKELKYSVRSAEMYLKPDRIVVVGDKPDLDVEWLKTDKLDRFNDVNNSLRVALENIEGKWVLMHDDFFILEPYKPILRHNGKLYKKAKRTAKDRRECFQNILDVMPEAMNYALHYPLPFDVGVMREAFEKFKQPFSYMNAYSNLDKDFVHLHAEDCKFSAPLLTEKYLKGLPSFSTYNENDRFELLLQKLYPNKSKYES